MNILIENSIKYSPDGSSIRINVKHLPEDEILEICFKDEGRGIDPEDIPYIFDPFFRGKNTEEQRTPGNGIGLSLVRDIIKKHQGEILVNSQRHKGTSLTILFRVTPESVEV